MYVFKKNPIYRDEGRLLLQNTTNPILKLLALHISVLVDTPEQMFELFGFSIGVMMNSSCEHV